MKALARLLSIQLFILLISLPDALRAEEEPAFSQRELDRILAPIALYPDVVLSQVLMAATYPLEVVEAARWAKANPGLDGEAAVDAVADKDWDASVKALVGFPRLLERMDADLEWTRRLGDAFLFQQAEVMDTIQDLRQRAYDAGSLDTPDQVRVIRDGDTIVIEPADPRIVYVPYYDTRVIYGGWWWPAYPPYYWAPPPDYYAGTGFYWGGGVLFSTGFYYSYLHWPHRQVVIVKSPRSYPHRQGHAYWHDHAAQGGAREWRHDSRHRRGVVYRDRGFSHNYGRPRASTGGTGVVVDDSDRPRDGHYRHGSRGGRDTAGRDDGRRRFAGRDDAPRAGVAAARRTHDGRYAGKRRDVAAAAPVESPRDIGSGDRRGADRDASPRSPRAQAAQPTRGRSAWQYDTPSRGLSRPGYLSAPRHGVSTRIPAFK